MIRKMLLILCVSTAGASAQKPDALETAKKIWAGVWEGPAWHIGDSNPIGGYRLEIGRDSVWKVHMDVIAGQTTSVIGTEFTPDGNRATWMAALMGDVCKTTATVDGTKLKGETRCGEHGGLSFELTKRQ
jgi:hypothetical protein